MSEFINTAEKLSALSITNRAVLVSFSGSKDSLVVLDLASRYFKTIKCFYMYVVDNLSFIESQLDFAREKYGVEVIKVPHWGYWQSKAQGVYCRKQDVPNIRLLDIYRYLTAETGIDLIFTGAKKSDSMWRRQYTKQLGENFKNVINPIWNWNLYDVLAYLKLKEIPIPKTNNQIGGGVDFTFSSLLFIYDNYPDDFDLIEQEFPFVRAVAKRREWFDGTI